MTIGADDGARDPVNLSEDKKTMVADNHGWEGKRYTAEVTAEVARRMR